MILDGQHVLITGAKGGLGNVVTRAFLMEGARVAGVSRSISAADFAHAQFTAIPGDLGSPDGARAVLNTTLKAFGRLDAVVHLVGGFVAGHPVETTPEEEVERMLDLNLRSAWNIARVALPVFRAQGRGRFAAIASSIVDHPAPMTGAYAASKAAVWALLRTLDEEGRNAGIRARALTPGTLDEPTMQAVTRELLEFVSS